MHNMYDGGLENKPHSVQIFRLAGLFIPILLISYGFLLQIGAIKTNHNIDSLGFIIISFWWLYVSIIQFVFPIKTKLDATMRLISYHLLAGSYLVYVSGIFSPITICWLLLILASYLLFSFNGFLMSYFGLIIVIMIDISSINNNNETILVNNMIVMLSILITSLAILSILQDQETSKKELLKSKAKELLEHDRIITIINNLSDAVISTDTDGFIKVYNAACLNLLDTNININGHYIDEILPLIDQNKNKIRMFEELKNSKTVTKRDDLKYVFNKDDEIRIEITHSPIRSSYNNIKKLGTNDGYILLYVI